MLKKLFALMMVLALTACGGGSSDASEAADGFYFAQGEFAGNGWAYYVAFDVDGGKFKNVEWNGVHQDGGKTKAELAEAGLYVLANDGGPSWATQAEDLVKYFEKEQSVDSINLSDDDGHTDSVSGVTVKVSEFNVLVKEALENGPVEKGEFADGEYYAEVAEFANGWKYQVGMTVRYGRILSAGWNAVNEEDAEMTKRKASVDGEYVMNDESAPWHEQAAKIEKAFLAAQDIKTINLSDEEGHTDAVSGVTIKVGDYVALVEEALANGPQ